MGAASAAGCSAKPRPRPMLAIRSWQLERRRVVYNRGEMDMWEGPHVDLYYVRRSSRSTLECHTGHPWPSSFVDKVEAFYFGALANVFWILALSRRKQPLKWSKRKKAGKCHGLPTSLTGRLLRLSLHRRSPSRFTGLRKISTQ